jgi:hypothetical protein
MFNLKEHLSPSPRKNAMAMLEKDCQELEKAGDTREILASFTTDAYQPIDDEYNLTRKAITIFHKYNRPYSILTKGGYRSQKDFDLMEQRPDLARYATTLTVMNKEDIEKWEPFAAPWYQRIDALRNAHIRGIKTWVSIEPIVDPAQSLYLINDSLGSVDLYRIGIMNHKNPGIPEWDLFEFIKEVKYIMEANHKPHVFKKDTLAWFEARFQNVV